MDSHEKKKLRLKMKKSLKGISEKSQKEKKLSINLIKLLNELDQEMIATIGGFAPFSEEPNWLLALCEKRKSKLSFPKTDQKTDQEFSMNFYLSLFEQLEENNDFGITLLAPREEAKIVVPEILIVPGLAFNKEGDRLGRGKGYYDRYLKDYQGCKVGVCFEEQLLIKIPINKYDQNIDILVTDKEIYRCYQDEDKEL